jgi:hypothetical protein
MNKEQRGIVQARFKEDVDFKMNWKLQQSLGKQGQIHYLDNDLFTWFIGKLREDGHKMGLRDCIEVYKCMKEGVV